MRYRSVAIDGPSGAGKSTLAKSLAKEFGFLYVDTGAIYRTVGLAVSRRGIDPAQTDRIRELLPQLNISMEYGSDGLQHMLLDGEDVSQEIRQHAISGYTSRISAIPEVRDFLMDMQRRLAAAHDVIMDGRDIGTVVLPEADLKIYLTASSEDRARRRYAELLDRGQKADYPTILHDVKERDLQDMERETAPLKKAEDAVEVDTTGKNQEESFRILCELIRDSLGI